MLLLLFCLFVCLFFGFLGFGTGRAVVVAGGTMQPVWEFQYGLFGAAGAAPERVMHFACGHVVPPHHLLPLALCRGPSGQSLDFTWAKRGQLIDELGRLVSNLAQVPVPPFATLRSRVHQILPRFTGFYWVSLGFTRLY